MGHFIAFFPSFLCLFFSVISSTIILIISATKSTADVRQQQRMNERMSEMAPLNNVSSHVLDISVGQPAQGVKCTAYRWKEGENCNKKDNNNERDRKGEESNFCCCWELCGQTETNEQGRIANVHPGKTLSVGIFKLHFHTKEYFKAQNRDTFYPFIEVVFQIDDPTVHYHVPITLSNFGYSTYRGQ